MPSRSRPNGCPSGKIPYPSRTAAQRVLARFPKPERKGPYRMTEFRCDHCGFWHLGHKTRRPDSAPPVHAQGRRADDLRAYLASVRQQAATKTGVTVEVRVAALRAEVELAVLNRKAQQRGTK